MTGIHTVTELPVLPPRPQDSHKGTFGRVMIVAGSRGMAGAAALAGLGALRGGAGLVYLAVPRFILNTVAAIEPSYITVPMLNDRFGQLCVRSRRRLLGWLLLKRLDALAVGPGLGRSFRTQRLILKILPQAKMPTVIDADGLSVLTEKTLPSLKTHQAPRILTPHPGEFASMVREDIQEVQENREQMAIEFARQYGVVLVLKGHRTVVTDGARLYLNTTGNAGMATGGTGDVLTGLITALLAQGMAPFDAAQLGTYLHGLAGDLAAQALSQPGLIASDLPKFLPAAWLHYEGSRRRETSD